MDIHSLRHAFASAMIRAARSDAERVRRLTGRSTSKVLLDVCTHGFQVVRGGSSIAEEAALIDAVEGSL